ncbi:hypothetical protein RM704_33405 [Streptomyces sp. DSM 3412]|uniref:Uncharacterized protein n=1 Tax=Streptomyces gottesmaniae TaxID=3075518 RepID=A0ABU2Z7M7_9ACTN|nr:hypothetical protein [Streptomyces sp. DSM 3412]MDT0572299.1 hypothetical protein [Streptomyces sp. DSM 3412]
MDVFTAVLPVVTLMLGAWMNQLSEAKRENAALQRERQVRELDREQSRLDRREAFELDHLAKASECLSRLFSAALMEHLHRVNAASPAPQADAFVRETEELARLQALILDEGIRTLVESARQQLSKLGWAGAGTPEELGDLVVQSHNHLTAAQEALASRLRTIYGA